MRLEALSQLSNGNLTVTAARFLLFLLFLVIECLPVTVKLLQRPGQYEAALREAKQAEQRDYEKFFSTRSRLRHAGFARRPAGPPGAAARGRLTPGRSRTRSGTAPGGCRRCDSPEDETPTETFRDPGIARPGRGADYGPPGGDRPARAPLARRR